jgi:hypothetical protein
MRYAVKILNDEDLPEDLDWCLLRERHIVTACVKRSRLTDPHVLAEAWAGARHARQVLALSA